MAIRPEDVAIQRSGEAGGNTVVGTVRSLEFRGPLYRLSVHLPVGTGRILSVQADVSTETMQRLAIHEGMDLPIHLPAERIRVYLN
jgi:iron(III) transport system ATP-binding protein